MSSPFPSFSCSGNGQPVPPETAQRLKAGPLSVDLIEGELRYFHAGADEAVRRIYAAVRDSSWNTVAAWRTGLRVEQSGEAFEASWQSEHVDGDVDFAWESRISGTADGVIRWEFDGVARRAFAKNRVGFCILHPLALCQGKPCEMEYVSGDVAECRFPGGIAPDQPVRGLHDFRRMRYAVNPAWDVELTMEGDAFEMEDQRNWTDASFKTYSTPQRIPLPAWLKEGQRVRQVVTVRLVAGSGVERSHVVASQTTRTEVTLVEEEGALPWPQVGLGLPSHGGLMDEREVQRLRALGLDHVRVDVKMSGADWAGILQQAGAEAERLGCALEIALHLTEAAGAWQAAEAARQLPCPVARWLVIEEGRPVANPGLLKVAREALGAGVGMGTDIDYFPLNSHRPAVESADFIFCSIRPQAHAFDDATVIENLDGQTHLVASARQVFAPLPFVASPVTLKRRWHKGPPRPATELPPMVDRRQLSLLGAGWLVGSLRALAEAGAASATWFETTGWRGVMELAGGASLPEEFPSVPGAVFPMYHVLRALADFREGGLRRVRLSHPLQVQAVVLESAGRQRWIVANVTGLAQQVKLPVGGALRVLDAAAAALTGQEPEGFWSTVPVNRPAGDLELAPWTVVILDVRQNS